MSICKKWKLSRKDRSAAFFRVMSSITDISPTILPLASLIGAEERLISIIWPSFLLLSSSMPVKVFPCKTISINA
ncbi:Uncharacterised protein [uncultured archaeon]|nr:Uncharacterised protein [uncultured archaeon]